MTATETTMPDERKTRLRECAARCTATPPQVQPCYGCPILCPYCDPDTDAESARLRDLWAKLDAESGYAR